MAWPVLVNILSTNLGILKHMIPKKRCIFWFLPITQFHAVTPCNDFTSQIYQGSRGGKVFERVSSPYPSLSCHAKFCLVRRHELLFIFHSITVTRCYEVASNFSKKTNKANNLFKSLHNTMLYFCTDQSFFR